MHGSHEAMLDTARRLAAALKPGDLDQTLRQITDAAVEVLPEVDFASITVRHSDGPLTTAAATHEGLLTLDAIQYELREGPCYDAATDTLHVVSPDLSDDPRFPQYGPAAVRAGIQSQAAFRLFEIGETQGALNLYSKEVGAFRDLESVSLLFKHHAATAIAYAHEITNLKEALATRKRIGQAMGIVMERYELSDERAFAFLTRLSQHRNVKLRLVAEELIAEVEQRSAEISGGSQ
jgi:hypothetical protein